MADRAAEPILRLESETMPAVDGVPPCPVDRLPRRRRNQVCIGIIVVGLLNFLAYTVTYAAIGGDAFNGAIERVASNVPGEPDRVAYVVAGHFIETPHGRTREVPRWVWLYSYLHSLTVPITSAALIISMLVLARPHIIATMRDGWLSGSTFIAGFGTIVIVGTLFVVALFLVELFEQLQKAG
jgi:hypothetical protein